MSTVGIWNTTHHSTIQHSKQRTQDYAKRSSARSAERLYLEDITNWLDTELSPFINSIIEKEANTRHISECDISKEEWIENNKVHYTYEDFVLIVTYLGNTLKFDFFDRRYYWECSYFIGNNKEIKSGTEWKVSWLFKAIYNEPLFKCSELPMPNIIKGAYE